MDTHPKNRSKIQNEIIDKKYDRLRVYWKDTPAYYELFLRLLRLTYRNRILKYIENSRYIFYHQIDLPSIKAKQKSELLDLMCDLRTPDKPELEKDYGLLYVNGATKLCYGATLQEVEDIAHSANLRELNAYPDLKDFYQRYFIDFEYPGIVKEYIDQSDFFESVITSTKIEFDFVVVDSVYSLNAPRGKGKKDPKEKSVKITKPVLT